MEPVARIRSEFPTKFGVPRQAGLVEGLLAQVVFEPPYRVSDALRGIEGFSHLWLIWEFSENKRTGWSPTVRPPRLGGNQRMGVFATRSPFRPNPLGLSCVKLEKEELSAPDGPVLWVSGADLVDGTPILDIKPYLPYADCHPEATAGFAGDVARRTLAVVFPEALEARVAPTERQALRGVLAQDPRPSYQDDPARVYGVAFGKHNVRFTVDGEVLTVVDVEPLPCSKR